MTTPLLLRGRAARADQARSIGYLLTDSATALGAGIWRRECWRIEWPFIMVALSEKRARIYAELDDVPFSDTAQSLMRCILAEHSRAAPHRRCVSDLSICCERLSHAGAIIAANRLVALIRSERQINGGAR